MRQLFILGSLIMVMYGTESLASALLEKDENEKIKQSILYKARQEQSAKTLTLPEKEWLYETNLMNSVKNLKAYYKKHPEQFIDFEDLTNDLNQLANFYAFKGKNKLAHITYSEAAKWQLKAALLGSANHLAFLNSLTERGILTQQFTKTIEQDTACEDTDKVSDLLKDKKKFAELQNTLANALQENNKQSKRKRKELGLPSLPLYDKSLHLIFQKQLASSKRLKTESDPSIKMEEHK
jgi:hypothetical protein